MNMWELVAVKCTGVSSSIGSSVKMRPFVRQMKSFAASLCMQAVSVNRNIGTKLAFSRILHLDARLSSNYCILDIKR